MIWWIVFTVLLILKSTVEVDGASAISYCSDFGEERVSNGDMNLDSSDLEMGIDPARGAQLVGLRFENLAIPAGANITRATVKFVVDEVDAGVPLELSITVSLDAGSFIDQIYDVTDRTPIDGVMATWSPPQSTVVGQEITSVDVSPLIAAAVDSASWTGDNAIVLRFAISSGTGVRIYESRGLSAPQLTVDYFQAGENDRLLRLERLLNTVAEEQRAAVEEADRLRGVVGALGRQAVLASFENEVQVRSRGGSGLRGVRSMSGGSRPYHTAAESSYGFANIHDHADHKNTIGMGEVGAVINGVEFRTRHNDYRLAQPSNTTSQYHANDEIITPDVPPSVLAAGSVAAQVAEMQEYFRAFATQNVSHRDYRPFFRPVISYMEGAWVKAGDEVVEPFFSERHSIAGETWTEVHETARFLANSGVKNRDENMVVLPQAVRNMRGDVPEFAQFEYRIMAQPVKGDIPLNRLRVVDDLATAMRDIDRGRKIDDVKKGKHRTARFQLDPECSAGLDGCPTTVTTLNDCVYGCQDTWNDNAWSICWSDAYCTWPEQDNDSGCNSWGSDGEPFVSTLPSPTWSRCRSVGQGAGWRDGTSPEGLERYTFLDFLMEEIPGKDNAGCYLNDTFDRSLRWTDWDHPEEEGLLNVCKYSRFYESAQRDAMGRDHRRRSFNDPNLWAARTTQDIVSGISVSIDHIGNGCDGCTDRLEQKWTWAFPLEIIYMTPLTSWNPYGLPLKDRSTVTANGRDGGLSQSEAFDGISESGYFYQTPAEFFEGSRDGGDPADTDLGVVGVLDAEGEVRRVVASGHWITFPKIAGIAGEIRQRYPIAPVHDEDSTTFKELKALADALGKDLGEQLVGGARFRNTKNLTDLNSDAISLTLTAGSTGHEHALVIPARDVPTLLSGQPVASTSERRNGHTHEVQLRLVGGEFVIDAMDPWEDHGIAGDIGGGVPSTPSTSTSSSPTSTTSTTFSTSTETTSSTTSSSTTSVISTTAPTSTSTMESTSTSAPSTGTVHTVSWGWNVDAASITITVGDTVRWVWNQTPDGQHNIVSGERNSPSGLFQSAYFSSGGEFTYTFTSAGSYPYHCTPHGSMNAVIHVIESSSTYITSTTTSDLSRSALDCGTLGWPFRFGNVVCGESDRESWTCTRAVPFSVASNVCSALGARLCTTAELHADATRGTGCGHDNRRIWASDDATCSSGQRVLAFGRSGRGDATCASADSTTFEGADIGVRCCADPSSSSPEAMQQVMVAGSEIFDDYGEEGSQQDDSTESTNGKSGMATVATVAIVAACILALIVAVAGFIVRRRFAQMQSLVEIDDSEKASEPWNSSEFSISEDRTSIRFASVHRDNPLGESSVGF